MTSTDPSLPPSCLDTREWQTSLRAHVVMPSSPPRLHGYDAEGDLARRGTSPSELLLLLLTGELPSRAAVRALDVATTFLAPVLVGDAPAHAAVIARICACPTSAVVGTAAVATALRASRTVAAHTELLAWLPGIYGAPPESCCGSSADAPRVARLRAAIASTGLEVPALVHDLTSTAALLAVLHACGLDRAERMEVALTMAQLPCAVAEALCHTPADLSSYPVNLPPFRYEGGER